MDESDGHRSQDYGRSSTTLIHKKYKETSRKKKESSIMSIQFKTNTIIKDRTISIQSRPFDMKRIM